ncbi:hypothetical protein AAE02nite_09620 [Adhaeribacter aerolatus]|uniref:7(1) septoil knot domain-containing protein n=1 Tax=Adhaeribacter aerolatus TaxID=670289 RepID=A0A512AUB4_9BACT|nr:DUF6150 family protein [Adhaeribacter aerolatus]GEO03298.1 hypothetical protein AAE02nite_09620 [Adhaeribacter aerolatus]
MLYFLPLFFFLLGLGSPAGSTVGKPETIPIVAPREPEICRMFGSIYLTADPKQKNYARFTVYIDTEDTYADLLVFRENNKLFADAPGLWYITTSRNFADHVLFITTNRAFADFTIHYTKARTFAGCRK